jgi:hypothetical protein
MQQKVQRSLKLLDVHLHRRSGIFSGETFLRRFRRGGRFVN